PTSTAPTRRCSGASIPSISWLTSLRPTGCRPIRRCRRRTSSPDRGGRRSAPPSSPSAACCRCAGGGRTPMPSTFFTESPHWQCLIILYFFIGGLAGGCYFVASLIDLAGRPTDRPLARLGYLLAFPAVVICGLLLIADLGRPERFWHMLLQSG